MLIIIHYSSFNYYHDIKMYNELWNLNMGDIVINNIKVTIIYIMIYD